MQRDTAVAIVLALLALLAIGAAGATLENPADTDSGSGFGGGSGTGIGQGDSSGNASSTNVPSGGGGLGAWTGEIGGACMAILQTFTAKLLLAGTVAALSGYVWWRTDSLGMGIVTAVLYGPLVWIMWFALAGCQTLREGMQPMQPQNRTEVGNGSAGGSGGLGSTAETVTSQPSLLLGIVLVVLVLAAIVLLYVASADDLVDSQMDRGDDEESEDETTDIAAVGRVAGEAADRIETGDAFDNEVFRAWAEMTEHLAVQHPESSTPAEFATAAVDAGMAPDDVRELTALFEEVRYGDREVTADREERATAALRRIEASYAEEGEE